MCSTTSAECEESKMGGRNNVIESFECDKEKSNFTFKTPFYYIIITSFDSQLIILT